MYSVNLQELSFLRRRETILVLQQAMPGDNYKWFPACAGMTAPAG
jgi:hypothetical protein